MSPVATLVKPSTRYLLLVGLPGGSHKADVVADALAAAVAHLPEELAKSLTGDQGHEMAEHKRFTNETSIQVYIYGGPKSPRQRQQREHQRAATPLPAPEDDFKTLTQADLDAIALELNDRPRQTLAFKTPSQALAEGCVDRLSPQA